MCVEGDDDGWVDQMDAAVRSLQEALPGWTSQQGAGVNLAFETVEIGGLADAVEETALLRALQGRRGTPRPRPPYPIRDGLGGRPTVVHDVETWAGVAAAVARGFGSDDDGLGADTKVMAVFGAVRKPAVIELSLGAPWRRAIAAAGGPLHGEVAALHAGGCFGGFVPASSLDDAVDLASLRALGATVGPCHLEVFRDTSSVVDRTLALVEEGHRRSCGACPPCRIGGRVLLGLLRSLADGRARPGDVDLMAAVADHVTASSLCRVGHNLPRPVRSLLENFSGVARERCQPAGRC
jgi:NADH:ubiquinone oxidoreductase subunit F (NADH-binding)